MQRVRLESGRQWLVVILAATLASCSDPVPPRASIPTLDDPGAGRYVAVAGGREHSCALTTDSLAYCWGSNEYLQVGAPRGATTCTRPRDDRAVPCVLRPVPVSGGIHFARISAGGTHTCGLGGDRHIYCWGDNLHGQLGTATVRETFTPTPVDGGALYMDVAASGNHSCGLRADGVIMCWGANDQGQLGQGTSGAGVVTPTPAIAAARFFSISSGENRTCARATDGRTFCWGAMWVTYSLDGDVRRIQAIPIPTPDAPAFQSIGVGVSSTCGVTTTSVALCWESNSLGTFGNGSTGGSIIPIPVAGPVQYVSISSGARHTCALSNEGHAYCWGADDHGQLGVSPFVVASRCRVTVPCNLVPIRVTGWRVFAFISASLSDHTCGVTGAQNVYCWGGGSMGQRGDGSRFDSSVPIRVAGPPSM